MKKMVFWGMLVLLLAGCSGMVEEQPVGPQMAVYLSPT